LKSKLDELKEIQETANEDEWKANIERIETFSRYILLSNFFFLKAIYYHVRF
jgi:hypothetical protein